MAAICGVVGVLVTWFFVRDLDGGDLAKEDERFRAFLVSKGWIGDMGEADLKAGAEVGVREVEDEDEEVRLGVEGGKI